MVGYGDTKGKLKGARQHHDRNMTMFFSLSMNASPSHRRRFISNFRNGTIHPANNYMHISNFKSSAYPASASPSGQSSSKRSSSPPLTHPSVPMAPSSNKSYWTTRAPWPIIAEIGSFLLAYAFIPATLPPLFSDSHSTRLPVPRSCTKVRPCHLSEI